MTDGFAPHSSSRAGFFSLVTLIIAINLGVFVLWHFGSDYGFSREGMANNFLVSWTALQEGRYYTLLTSAFSHNMGIHILFNMIVLNSFGRIMETVLGKKLFLSFYIVAGVISSFCHAFVSAYFMHNPDLPALGASGAIAGLILVFSLMFPKEKILLFGIIPLPAIFGAIAFIGLDIWGLMAQVKGGGLPIGHGAHLGGAFTGIIFYLFVLLPKLRRRHI